MPAVRVPAVLREYEAAQCPRVEAAQENPRRRARLLFRRSRALAALRDLAVRVVPLQAALDPIRALLQEAAPPSAR